MSHSEASYDFENLEHHSIRQLLEGINREDHQVAKAVTQTIPQIEKLIQEAIACIEKGGRIFYLGAGTSGRLGVLDASELPPTFGVPNDVVIGVIAGGDRALRNSVEAAEDDPTHAWKDLQAYHISPKDLLIGIAASGTTPYVLGGIRDAKAHGLLTSCITTTPDAPIVKEADLPIVAKVGPEFISGSTRLKAGTAQKMILNMISTTLMIKLGRVLGNNMVDMKISNQKLENRGIQILMEKLDLSRSEAKELLGKHGSVRLALNRYDNNLDSK